MKIDGIVGAVLLIVLLVVLAVPVVHDATIDKVYHDNAGSGTPYGTGSITITKTGSGITANGTAATAPSNIILWNNSMYLMGNVLYVWDQGSLQSYQLTTVWTLQLRSSGNLTIYTETGSGVNYQYTEHYSGQVSLGSTYHLKPTGNYVYVGTSSTLSGARIDYSSQIIGLSATPAYAIVYGDADNRNSYTIGASGGIGEATLTAAWDDSERCFTVSGLTGSLNGQTITPNKIFVPAQYYSEEDKDGTAYQLLKVLPLIIAMGIVCSIAYAIRRKRYA